MGLVILIPLLFSFVGLHPKGALLEPVMRFKSNLICMPIILIQNASRNGMRDHVVSSVSLPIKEEDVMNSANVANESVS